MKKKPCNPLKLEGGRLLQQSRSKTGRLQKDLETREKKGLHGTPDCGDEFVERERDTFSWQISRMIGGEESELIEALEGDQHRGSEKTGGGGDQRRLLWNENMPGLEQEGGNKAALFFWRGARIFLAAKKTGFPTRCRGKLENKCPRRKQCRKTRKYQTQKKAVYKRRKKNRPAS